MRTLQAELRRLNLPGTTGSSRPVEEQSQDVKHWQSDYDWSEVETELLESQAQDQEAN